MTRDVWVFLFLSLLSFLSVMPLFVNASSPYSSQRPSHASECDALLQFRQSFTISRDASALYCDDFFYSANTSYPKTTSWQKGTDCCSWDGVTCHMSKDYVIGLDLSCSWLRGALHSNSSLFSLRNLQRLNLAGNDFTGSPISSTFGILTGLAYLNLSSSSFSGIIPLEMISHHLSSLISLDLSGSYSLTSSHSGLISLNLVSNFGLTVEEDRSFRRFISNLTQLRELALDKVDMSRVSLTSLMNLSSTLTSLRLGDCHLQGTFPINIFHLPNLRILYLSANYDLTGALPQTNWSSSPLVSLGLSYTKFHGSIPDSVGNLTSLEDLALFDSGFTGSIPPTLGNLDRLYSLSLGGISLGGTIDFDMFARRKNLVNLWLWRNLNVMLPNIGNCSFPRLKTLSLYGVNLIDFPYFLSSSPELEWLDLSGNKISGPIPKWFGRVWRSNTLVRLDLSSNNFTGAIPSSEHFGRLPIVFFRNSNLKLVNLANNNFDGLLPIPPPNVRLYSVENNKFSGDIPHQLCSATLLDVLNLSNNSLIGSIPQCFINLSASVLDLRANKLVGQISDIFFSWKDLRTIRLSQNRLEGILPRSLENCKNLEVLDLSENELEGRFPYWLDTLPNLQVLDLRSNKFHGLINSSTKNNHPFPHVHIFDISNNSFHGPLPIRYIANLEAMKDEARNKSQYTWINYSKKSLTYQDSVTVVMKGFTFELVRILSVFTTIDLSRNFFGGDIPELMGDLKALKGLNLSHNNLTGRLPSSVENLTNLEWLDLSSNKLNGGIPRGLADLSGLCWLNLSDNQLVGPIPRSTQFDTFNNSFDGNPGLCGNPLPKACGTDDLLPPSTSPGEREDEAESGHWIEWRAVPMGYGCGLALGISAWFIMWETLRPRWLARMTEGLIYRMTKWKMRNVGPSNRWRRNTRGQ